MDKVHSEASVEQTATYDLGVIVIVGLVGHEDTLGRARLACDASAYLGRFSEGQIRPGPAERKLEFFSWLELRGVLACVAAIGWVSRNEEDRGTRCIVAG